MQHLVSHSDLAHVIELGHKPVAWLPIPLDEQRKFRPNVSRFVLDNGQIAGVFHVKPIYYRTKWNTWRPLEEVCHTLGNRHIILKWEATERMHPAYMRWLMKRQQKLGGSLVFDGLTVSPYHLAYATTDTFYPDPHTETSTIDGYYAGPSNASWDSAHDAAAASVVADSTSPTEVRVEFRFNSQWIVNRYVAFFDTSSIGSSDSITSATFTITDNGGATQMNMTDSTNSFMTVVQCVISGRAGTDASLNVADFDLVGSALDNPTEAIDSGDRLSTPVSSPGAGTDYNFPFNSNGIGFIAKNGQSNPTSGTGGITYLGIRAGEDVTDTPGSQSTVNRNKIEFYSAENTGTDDDPRFTATWEAGAATVTPTLTLLGVG